MVREQDRTLALTATSTKDTDSYFLNFVWHGAGSVGTAQAAAFSLIGSFAESATYVCQRRVASDGDGSASKLQFEVGTGKLASDARFEPHGHVVVINLAGVP